MKTKKWIVMILTVALSFGLLVGCGKNDAPPAEVSNSDTETVDNTTSSTSSGSITSEEAQDIALKHAGVSASAATFFRTDYEWDDNTYEVEFYADKMEYDYEISAATGDILSYDSEVEGFNIGDGPSGETASAGLISEEEVKAIALKHAGLSETDVKGLRVTRDRDDGVMKYEVEFREGFTEYEYEINAENGEIISFDMDKD